MNTTEQRSLSGVVLPSKGELYAVCDYESYNELYEEASKIRKEGYRTHVNTSRLDEFDGVVDES